jgi:uncharacterized membrane protein YdjX (TVP38/TMEM64 family)
MIQSYGQVGLLIVMIIQTIIAPIPSEALIVFSGAIGIKIMDIVIFGGLGTVIGAVLAFYIARIGGKPIITKLIGDKWINRVDGWVERKGTKAILFARLIPIIPFDLISYVSGITKLKFRNYFFATVIGAFPRCLILAIIGFSAKEILLFIGAGLEITLMVGVAGFIILAYLDKKGYIDILSNSIVKKIINKIS